MMHKCLSEFIIFRLLSPTAECRLFCMLAIHFSLMPDISSYFAHIVLPSGLVTADTSGNAQTENPRPCLAERNHVLCDHVLILSLMLK